MINTLLKRRIKGATPKTETVQEGQYQPGARVDKVLVKTTQEIVVREVTAEEEADHRMEAEEIQKA